MSNPTIGIVAMCDQVYRDATTNKMILSGLYSGDMTVTAFPAQTTMAFYVEILSDIEQRIEFQLNFYVAGEKVGGVKDSVSHPKNANPSIVVLPARIFEFGEPVDLEMKIAMNDNPEQSILKKRVILVQPIE